MIFIIILLSVCLLDLMIKKYAEANLAEGEVHSIFRGKILIRKLHNDGIATGKFADKQEIIEKGTFVMMLALLVFFVRLLMKKGKNGCKTGLALVLGGAFCNWFDRFHQHTVTDYFSFNVKWKKLKELVFNLSDFCIAAGTVLMLFSKKK